MLNRFAGNNEIKNAIKSIIKSGRFPHAFIIEGEVGSGRKTLARMLAAAAICGDADAPCGKCRECELIEKDGFCDVLTYSPDGATFKVDIIREIRENAYIMPIEAKRKVNILLDCDKMNEPAQNALLKVLEEPPSFMVFILVCRSASSLLPTVRSRCITLSVQNPEKEEALAYLNLSTGKSEADINEALSAANGNIGVALSVLNGEANQAKQNAVLFLQALKNRDRISALKAVYVFEKDRLGFNIFLEELKLFAKKEMKQYSLTHSSEFYPSVLARLYSLVDELQQDIKNHVGQPLSIPLISTTLCAQIFANS